MRSTSIPIPTVRSDEVPRLAQRHGPFTTARIYGEESDALLDSGLHPRAFLSGSYSVVDPPTLVLTNERGEQFGVDDCNAGYNGSGPHRSRDLLRGLGFPGEAADMVLSHAYLHLQRGDPVPLVARRRPLSQVHVPLMHVSEPHGVVRIALDTVGERVHPFEVDPRPPWRRWIEDLFDSPRLGAWASGERTVRVYLDRDAVDAHGFTAPDRPLLGPPIPHNLIIEQGRLQLWLAVLSPRRGKRFSRSAHDVLEACGFSVGEERPATRLRKFWAQMTRTPAWIDVSSEGRELRWLPARDPRERPAVSAS